MIFPEPTPKPRPPVPVNNPYPIRTPAATTRSPVDEYWGGYTIRSEPFSTAEEHIAFHKWRDEHFHKSYAFKGLWADHTGETLLDYGCGPGHDVTGFLVHSNPAKVYGVDVSHWALSLAGHNAGLQGVSADRIELIQTADLTDRIPLPDAAVDYVHSCGVVHHTSHPAGILKEFHRVLKPGGRGLLMVYNRASVFYHLYVAYARLILEPQWARKSIEEVFTASTDGPDCPVSICYEPAEFTAMCETAGFETEFVGGFVASNELDLWDMHAARALRDPRLGAAHKEFLKALDWDADRLPLYLGKYAGIGGTYRITRR
ncbi:MAG TPA: class I SAM-dependent methyltransferase [Gemmataceae bacterium]|nr:class I SAM-dependent methyltransferase [Gemmataceae bacterium]